MSLEQITPEPPELCELLGGLHALGHNPHLQGVREIYSSRYHRFFLRILYKATYNRGGDLQEVYREAVEVR